MNTAGLAWAPEQVPGPKNMHIKDAAKVCFHRLENAEKHTHFCNGIVKDQSKYRDRIGVCLLAIRYSRM